MSNMKINPESEYLEKLGEGDHKAYDALFLIYYPKVKNFLWGFLKDEQEAFDMAQDIFYKVWVNRKDISKVKSLKAYLFQMAKNMIYNHYEHNLVKESYIAWYEPELSEFDITDYIDARELEILIDITIEQMPEQRRRIFIMSRKEGMNNDCIAEKLQINKRTVENHITQALKDIRNLIQNITLFFI